MFRPIARTSAVLVAALVIYGCSDDTPTAPSNPTPPTIITEVFTGPVTQNGGATHSFVTQASGTVTAQLTAFSAPEGTRIGLALGTFNGSACQLVITKDDAQLASSVTGAVSALGNLCVRIYDVGQLTQPADYEIQVSHP